ncbi:hypothetical protein TI03_05555, partial [Achromatium sp. WMS1]
TGYQANLAPQHDIATVLSIEEQLRKENEELKLRLVDKDKTISELAEDNKILNFTPRSEKTYQAYLHGMIGGEREFGVAGPFPGRIDIATPQMMVEVKRVKDFEKAFGQLLRYRAQLLKTKHENKTYSIFLFGDVTEQEREVLHAMAEMTNFQLIIHKNLKDYIDEDELNKPGDIHTQNE